MYVSPNSVAGSMPVPSPHSFQLVTSCQSAVVAAILWTSASNRTGSRTSRGVGSATCQKPGETFIPCGRCCEYGVAGPYWCQESGWLAHVA
jgi:hypothetical protein